MVSIDYPSRTRKRANRAVACAPFRLALFQTLQFQSLSLRAIVADPGGAPHPYLRRSLPEIMVENDLLWLIQVGVLRREVDGQGITDRFRLTPLGHLLLQQWGMTGELPRSTWIDRLYNLFSRWFGV
ncbi:MAG: Npun_F0494 family protein [Prochlorotrichaceae cyanobacterium]|jgi:hypothetical protein